MKIKTNLKHGFYQDSLKLRLEKINGEMIEELPIEDFEYNFDSSWGGKYIKVKFDYINIDAINFIQPNSEFKYIQIYGKYSDYKTPAKEINFILDSEIYITDYCHTTKDSCGFLFRKKDEEI